MDQEVSIFKVSKEEVHLVFGAYGDWTWENAAAVCLLHNRYLEQSRRKKDNEKI